MDRTKDFESHKESVEDDSNETSLNSGSAETTEQNDNPEEFLISCRTTLVPSGDEPFYRREIIKRPIKTYQAIMRSFTSEDVYLNYDDSAVRRENVWQIIRLHLVGFSYRYTNFAVKFRNSKLIYIFQILLALLPLSAMRMGSKYADKCPGSLDLVNLSIVNGFFGLVLIAQWIAMKCCSPGDRPCEGYQKWLILLFFLLVSGLLELEIYLFWNLSPSFEPSATNYCNKIFYDYTYYKFIAAFASLFLVVMLYFPNFRNFA